MNPNRQLFNELTLREEIKSKWGEHGAHMNLYDRLLKSRNPLLSEIEMAKYEIDCANTFKTIVIYIFPKIFFKLMHKKHQRFMKQRYSNENE